MPGIIHRKFAVAVASCIVGFGTRESQVRNPRITGSGPEDHLFESEDHRFGIRGSQAGTRDQAGSESEDHRFGTRGSQVRDPRITGSGYEDHRFGTPGSKVRDPIPCKRIHA
ncbi:hypothetical protein AVEN_96233-1 [Araneus ventricosus]|uniref:Uncharacterized protein n=1 Tax=Araneus ventricosus TaxID=182803 RepID=A0A4Y2VWT7_ARAVE|nr:hypothetical protein AVEN_96233-1 [Araneus ventricosus]